MLEKIKRENNGITIGEYRNTNINPFLLHEGWCFRQEGSDEWLEAQVPGCNFTDLLHHAKIEDPFFGENEEHLQWIEEKNWEYKCVFKIEPESLQCSEIELVFEGLDTYCEVFLNGQKILKSENMFIAHRVPCKEYLLYGDNELLVLFRSPILENRDQQEKIGIIYPAENDRSTDKLSVFARKAPYHFGWDWGPRFVTSGIWRPVYLQHINKGRISNVHVTQHWRSNTQVKLDFDVEVDILEEIHGKLVVHSDQVSVNGHWEGVFKLGLNRTTLSVTLSNPKRWWPHGLGEAHLYGFEIELILGDSLVHATSERVGLRTVEVINEPDHFGESFYLKVNGQPVFMKGANYIPLDSFLPRQTKEKYDQLFRDVTQASMNMLRVWGGGTYEDDYFYQLADEKGILIWQDFMFACTLYPGTYEFLDNIKTEAVYNIKRLRNHACLALWCGNNEIEMGIEKWGWQGKFGYTDQQYEKLKAEYHSLFRQLLPGIVSDLDPSRFYLPSSPIGHWEVVSDDSRGDNHYWGVWHGEEAFEAYSQRVPRFMSEYGFQSFPLQDSVSKYIPRKDQHVDSASMKLHQKHPRGNRIISETILNYYRSPKDFESFLYLGQVVQAEGLKVAFEAHRKAKPFCMGSLYWQLNDCWPVASWSGIDYYGKWKALHYQAKRSFSTYLVLAHMEGGTISFYVVSDSLKAEKALLTLAWKDRKGMPISGKQLPLALEPNASVEVLSEEIGKMPSLPFCCVMTLTIGDKPVSKNIFYPAKIRDIDLPKPAIDYKLSEEEGRISIDLVSSTFVKNLYVHLEGATGNLSDNFFDLVPYEPTTLYYDVKDGDKIGELSFLSVYDTYNDRP